MGSSSGIPTSKDVVDFLNQRFEARGIPYRVEHVVVLPYVSPMWSANWGIAGIEDLPDREVIEEEIREARWQYPQVLEEF